MDRRNTAVLGVALALHLVVLVCLPTMRHSPPRKTHDDETSIDLEPGRGATGDGVANALATKVASKTLSHEWRTNAHGANPAEIEAPTIASAQGSASPSPSGGSLFLDRGAIGLDGPGSYRMEIAKRELPPEDSARLATETLNHALMDPIREHERQNGTLADGPVVMELERSTRQLPGSPFEGRAVFAIRIDELGLVVSASVEESSSDRRAWDEVATHAFNALAQKRLRLHPGAKGVAMRVEITSQVVYPSGARSHLAVSSPAADGLSQLVHGTTDKPIDTPAIVQGRFDLSDIGAHPARVVGAHVLSETAF